MDDNFALPVNLGDIECISLSQRYVVIGTTLNEFGIYNRGKQTWGKIFQLPFDNFSFSNLTVPIKIEIEENEQFFICLWVGKIIVFSFDGKILNEFTFTHTARTFTYNVNIKYLK